MAEGLFHLMKMRVVLFEKPNAQAKADNGKRASQSQKQAGIKSHETPDARLKRIDVKQYQKPRHPAQKSGRGHD